VSKERLVQGSRLRNVVGDFTASVIESCEQAQLAIVLQGSMIDQN
jgi:hypothetical protein